MPAHISQFLLDSGSAAASGPAYRLIWSKPAEKAASELVSDLLQASLAAAPESGCLVVAKPGLLPAWSAKALGILHACGLESIIRIDRGHWHEQQDAQHDTLLENALVGEQIAAWARGADLDSPDELRTEDTSTSMSAEAQTLLEGLGRESTSAEKELAAEALSEHCRHATFKSPWRGCGDETPLLDTLQQTHEKSSKPAVSAYSDHAAIIKAGSRHLTVVKTETHNHPTGLDPWSGAATGVGGEIRDEAATGIGGASRAGVAGFMMASANLEKTRDDDWPPHIASSAEVLLQAPLGAANYANEFGRPTLAGFCRFHDSERNGVRRAFIKPAMLAAGMGEISPANAATAPLRSGDLLVLLGGPGMRVGMRGGSASSSTGKAAASLESVQRADAQMQRRVQEVIDRCRQGKKNPIRGLHDLGAGGLGVALAELCAPLGCKVNLDLVPIAQEHMDAASILINEAQERFLALVAPADLPLITQMCAIESCPLAAIGKLGDNGRLEIEFRGERCVNLDAKQLLGPLQWQPKHAILPEAKDIITTDPLGINLAEACAKILSHPNVADKSFLITIADRGVGGLTVQDQFAGPLQVAVADCAITQIRHESSQGRAMACGERPGIAAIDQAAGARVAIAEALTNIAGAVSSSRSDIKLALNWLGDNRSDKQRGELVAAVRGAAEKFLLELDLAVVSGKDSLSMTASWRGANGELQEISSPTSCIATAFGSLDDVDAALTPVLSGEDETVIMRLGTAASPCLGASALADCYGLDGSDVADVGASDMRAWWETVRELRKQKLLLAYHDISDGGMLAAAAEMCFASGRGMTLVMDSLCQQAISLETDGGEMSSDATAPGGQARVAAELFSEQPGALVEISRTDAVRALAIAADKSLPGGALTVGWPRQDQKLQVLRNGQALIEEQIKDLRAHWSALSAAVRAKRDCEKAAKEEQDHVADATSLYASPHLPAFPAVQTDARKPKATVLRDQGCNGHAELAAALDLAGFRATTVTVNELISGDAHLDCALLAIGGGFSHGDVFGAGRGTAAIFLHSERLREILAAFFAQDTLALGICNGCQILANLGELLPTAEQPPRFFPNRSNRFESRLAQVEVLACDSPFLRPLAGVRLPVPLACGEGRSVIPARDGFQPALRFCDGDGLAADTYPANPTGAEQGLCGFSGAGGRLTMMLPHPERAVRASQLSWCPPAWRGQATPWLDCFRHAADFLR